MASIGRELRIDLGGDALHDRAGACAFANGEKGDVERRRFWERIGVWIEHHVDLLAFLARARGHEGPAPGDGDAPAAGVGNGLHNEECAELVAGSAVAYAAPDTSVGL